MFSDPFFALWLMLDDNGAFPCGNFVLYNFQLRVKLLGHTYIHPLPVCYLPHRPTSLTHFPHRIHLDLVFCKPLSLHTLSMLKELVFNPVQLQDILLGHSKNYLPSQLLSDTVLGFFKHIWKGLTTKHIPSLAAIRKKNLELIDVFSCYQAKFYH